MAKLEEQLNEQTLKGTVPVNDQNLLQDLIQTLVLDDLNDINVSSPVNGQILGYNSGTNSWQNTNAAIADGDKGDITTSGGGSTWTIDNNAVTEAKINTGAVTETKIGTSAVTETKIGTSAVTETKIANNAVTTNKINDAAVTNAKLANMATATVKGRATAGTGVPEDLAIDNDLSSVSANDDTIPSAKAVKAFVDLLELKTRIQNAGLINGKIAVSVASNDLTVAIKTLAGNDPSAGDPVYVWIDGTLRSITAALSVTANAGTNWFASGSAELATREVDYFAYIGFNATDGVTLGFSRLPYVNRYDGFNTTNTNERFARISTITNASASDPYVNIGRFAATLSAGAGHNWSVPSFTADNLIQRPIFETRRLSYTTQFSSAGSGTLSGNYRIYGAICYIWFASSAITIGAATISITATLPIASAVFNIGHATVNDNAGYVSGRIENQPNSNQLEILNSTGNGTNYTVGSGEVYLQHFYTIQ